MQKKIIAAVAIAAAIAAPAAFADVTVYGQANVSYDITDNNNNPTTNTDLNKVSSNASRLGFKGSEDLGNGLSAIWQIESSITLDTGAGALANRNSFAGLSSKDMGTVVFGNHDTPYKLATRKLDVFADTVADNRAIMGGGINSTAAAATFDGRRNNVVAYLTPNLNGFTGAIAYTHSALAAEANTKTDVSAITMNGAYTAGPLYATLAYEKHSNDVSPTNFSERAWKLGLGYSMDAFTANFVYENIDDNIATKAAGNDHHAYYLGGKYAFGMDAVKLAYTNSSDIGGVADTGATQWSLGYDHGMSKNTTVYALYTKLNHDKSAAKYALGESASNAVTGTDPSAFSFGLKHSF